MHPCTTRTSQPTSPPTARPSGSSAAATWPKNGPSQKAGPAAKARLARTAAITTGTPGAASGLPEDQRANAKSQRPRPPWRHDLAASTVVFLIAIPLSLGIALATGAPLQAGLVAAAVGGLVVGLLGGAPLQVSGPAAGLTVVTADLIQTYGWQATCAITIVAGIAQLLLGSLRVARAALVVSPPIVHGMLAGIGITVALAQLHIVLGGAPESSAGANLLALPGQLLGHHAPATGVGALTVLILVMWPRLPGRLGIRLRQVPAALAAVGAASAMAWGLRLPVPRVDLPSWSSHALPRMPEGPLLGLAVAVLTVTLVASVESLLSAVAIDRLHDGPRADLDRELRAQGTGNIVSGGLGGLPITGVAVRSTANVRAGAVTRASTVLHGCWVVLCVGLCAALLERIPLAALAALVMIVGVQMVSIAHIRHVRRQGEFAVYLVTVVAVVFGGVLEGVGCGIALAMAAALHRLARTRVTISELDSGYRVEVRGQLTFLGVPRLSGALARIPDGAQVEVLLHGSLMDHTVREALQVWHTSYEARGGQVRLHDDFGQPQKTAAPETGPRPCLPWTPWRIHRCVSPTPEHTEHTSTSAHTSATSDQPDRGHASTNRSALPGSDVQAPPRTPSRSEGTVQPDGPLAPHQVRQEHHSPHPDSGDKLIGGVSVFQRNTAPLVRDELARLAREGQQPSHLFLTCADSRLVTSMITSSGPGDLFTVRNVGNLVPLPVTARPTSWHTAERSAQLGRDDPGDDSVAAAIEYAVETLRIGSVTVCGHSGCGAMQALLHPSGESAAGSARTPLDRWLRHGRPSLERLRALGEPLPSLSDRDVIDQVEQLCLVNVVQQLSHLREHPCVAHGVRRGSLRLTGMYFDFSSAQAYVLDPDRQLFLPVGNGEGAQPG